VREILRRNQLPDIFRRWRKHRPAVTHVHHAKRRGATV
jgi:hypothetical protein